MGKGISMTDDAHADKSVFSRGCSLNENMPGWVDINCSEKLW